jgi:ABC-type antimicrobial peptide transport system permease subunit
VGENSPVCREIVGIVGDHRFTGGLDDPPVAAYFMPLAQAGGYRVRPKLFVRARGDPAELLPALRRLVQGFEPGLPAVSVHLMQTRLDPLLASWRLGAIAFTALGVVAAVIAGLGLFSVLAYVVAERRREFAIRGALGAQAGQILGPVLRQGVGIVALGCLAGAVIVWRGSPWVQPLLFHVRLLDPLVIGGVLVGLLLVALLASAGPARQATRLDPMDVLRSD